MRLWGVVLVLLGLLAGAIAQPKLRLEIGTGDFGWIYSASLCPDNRYVLTAGGGPARVWDLTNGKEVRRFGTGVRIATFSPDGRRVLTAGSDETVRLWDAVSGKELCQYVGHEKTVNSALFSPNGKFVLTASDDMTVRLWDSATRQEIYRYKGHSAQVLRASFSLDGQHVLTLGGDHAVLVWDVASHRQITRLDHGSFRRFNDASLSPNGDSVLTASDDNIVRLWSTASGKTIRQFKGHDNEVSSVVFSDDGRTFLSGSVDGTARLWDAKSGDVIRRFDHFGAVRRASLSKDNGYVVTAGVSADTRVWNALTGREVRHLKGAGAHATSAAISPKGRYVATGNMDGSTWLWDFTKVPVRLSNTAVAGPFSFVSFLREDEVVSTRAGNMRQWKVSTEMETRNVEHPYGFDYRLSKDGRFMLVDAVQGIQMYDLNLGKVMFTLASEVAAEFSPDDQQVLTIGRGNTVRLWSASSGKEERRFEGHERRVKSASFSSDGRYVVTTSEDMTARIWESASGKEILRLSGHTSSFRMAVFSLDGRHVLTTSDDDTVHLWDVATGEQRRRFEVHAWVNPALFFPDGKTLLITNGDDFTTGLWDVATGRQLCSLISYRDGGWAVTTPEGHYDSSDGGLNPNLYWVYEDPAKGILDTIDVTQLKGTFYVPGLLAKVMKREKLPELDLSRLPIFPKVDDVRPRGSTVVFNLEDRGGGIGEVRIFVDQQLVKTAKGQAGSNAIDLGDLLTSRPDAQIEVTASNRDDSLASPRAGSASGTREEAVTPTRYVAVIAGVYKYAGNNDGLSELSYAGDDAIAIARSALALARGLKLEPEIYLLTDHPGAAELKREGIIVLPSTKAAFRDVFENMIPAKGIWRKSDLMLLFMAGHGTALATDSGSRYAYFTSDALSADPKAILQNQEKWVVTDEDLVKWFTKIPGGKKALILDTCGAEAAIQGLALARSDEDRARTLRDLQLNTGMVALFGAASNAVSWELNGHGLLTYSLLRALATLDLGQGTANAVQVEALFSQVKKLTEDEAERNKLIQRPHSYTRNQNFPIGFLDAEGRSKIPFSSPVPLFGRVSLASAESGLDDLELELALSEALKTVAEARGTQPSPLRFVVGAAVGAQVRGLYSLKGDVVEVKLNILPPGKPPVPIPVTAPKAQIVGKMVEAITTWARVQKL